MKIAAVGAGAAAQATQQMQAREHQAAQTVTTPASFKPADKVEISASRSNRSNMGSDKAVKTVSMQAQMLRRMAERIIKEQYTKGNHLFMLLYGNMALQLDPSLRPEGMGMDIEIANPEQRQAVASAVEYFSPPPTARRILAAAEDVAGGTEALTANPALTDAFRSAVQAAFLSLQTEAGGNLPAMSQRTFEATMSGFDSWAKAAGEAAE